VSGNYTNGVYIVKTTEGEILQSVVIKEGIAYNETFQDYLEPLVLVSPKEDQAIQFDFGLSSTFNKMEEKLSQLYGKTTEIDLVNDVLTTIFTAPPILSESEEMDGIRIVEIKADNSLTTGMLIDLKLVVKTSSSEIVEYEFKNIRIDKTSFPPESVLKKISDFKEKIPVENNLNYSGTFPGTNISWYTSNDVRVKNSTTFHSESVSWASTAIGTIGWTARSNQVLCSNVVIDGEQFGGYAEYNSMSALQGYALSETFLTNCANGNANRTIRVNTYHEFKYSSTGVLRQFDADVAIAP
jgi:hypothetical protein